MSRAKPDSAGTQGRPDDEAPFEQLPIYFRGYVEARLDTDDDEKRKEESKPGREKSFDFSPTKTLIFDTETTTDRTQALRVGAYQLRSLKGVKEGLFYDPGLKPADREVIRKFASDCKLRLLTVEEFIQNIIYLEAYQTGAAIVGFNLPFDLSRLAIGATTARKLSDAFSLNLSDHPSNPPIQIKNLNSRSALIQFMALGDTGRRTTNRGIFMDVKTGAAALYGRSFSLASLGQFLKIENPKNETDEHGGPITPEYLDYLLRDVQATWECHERLKADYKIHNLTKTGFHRIYSEASIGKAYLKEMGIAPWASVQKDFPKWLTGKIMTAYFGGRAEVRIRQKITRVLYCDFRSMYPTVCTLMGLWQHFISEGDKWSDTTAETAKFLANATLHDFQNKATWKQLATLVRVQPDGEVFPVRAKYDGDPDSTIALNHLRSEESLWFTLADCVAAKFLSGKTPIIQEAISFSPDVIQSGLTPIDFAGNPDFRVDPRTDDLFKRVIELRQEVKSSISSAPAQQRDALKATEQALKLFANSTSYGINIEVIVENHSKKHDAELYGLEDEPVGVRAFQEEQPGKYFHPLLAVLITGAARLMLALAETLVMQKGLDWALCDTDSMALARPDGMTETHFIAKAREVVEWFQALNPYSGNDPLFKIEAENFPIIGGSKNPSEAPLYCLAISAKRYALFNLDPDGRPILRKISGHGLGHLLPPVGSEAGSIGVPEPQMNLAADAVPRWQHDVWFRIIEAQQAADTSSALVVPVPRYNDLIGFTDPAFSRYGATTPRLLAWFKTLNTDRKYAKQVKPFNFMYGLQTRGPFDQTQRLGRIVDPTAVKTNRVTRHQPHAVAPYDKDRTNALALAFDRERGTHIDPALLLTYEEALADYHLNTESKFQNGGRFDHGRTERRFIDVLSVVYIGKEADRLEEAFFLSVNTDIEYLPSPEGRAALIEEITAAIRKFGRSNFETATGLAPSHLSTIVNGAGTLTARTRARFASAITMLTEEADARGRLFALARAEVERMGLRPFAREVGEDPSNLRRALILERSSMVSGSLIAKLRNRFG